MKKVNFTTIAQGAYSGYQTASQMVIDNQEDWEYIWQQHTEGTEPPPAIPQVDFTNNQVIAVFAGEKPSGGYSVGILTVKIRDSQGENLPSLIIKIKYNRPQTEDLVTDELTQPYHIIKIPQIAVGGGSFSTGYAKVILPRIITQLPPSKKSQTSASQNRFQGFLKRHCCV